MNTAKSFAVNSAMAKVDLVTIFERSQHNTCTEILIIYLFSGLRNTPSSIAAKPSTINLYQIGQ